MSPFQQFVPAENEIATCDTFVEEVLVAFPRASQNLKRERDRAELIPKGTHIARRSAQPQPDI
jgi:hypothetical protein